jgi:hypothetical protein
MGIDQYRAYARRAKRIIPDKLRTAYLLGDETAFQPKS